MRAGTVFVTRIFQDIKIQRGGLLDGIGIIRTMDGGAAIAIEHEDGALGGLVAGVGQRILSSVSKHLVGRFFVALRKEVETPVEGAA